MIGRVLVVDAVPTNRIILTVKLGAAFYDVVQAADGVTALDMINTSKPDMVIASSNLPDMSGQAFCAAVRQLPHQKSLPVVLVSDESKASERKGALAAGADDVLMRPIDDLVMLARLRSLLRARDAERELDLRDDTRRALGLAEGPAEFQAPASVVLVPAGPMPEAKDLLADLRHRTSHRIEMMPLDAVLRQGSAGPDVIVIIESANGTGEGLSLLPLLKANSECRHASLIYVAHSHQRHQAAIALDMGANDLLASGPDSEELFLRLDKQIARKRVSDRLRANMRDGLRAAVIDPLTGLYNRRYAFPHLARLTERSAAQTRPYAILLADLDHFKRVNDLYGHAAGDAVLVAIATRLRESLRSADLLARYGGEEFLIAMPDTSRDKAYHTAQRLCRKIAEEPVRLPNGETIQITVSIGLVTCMPGDGTDTPADLLEKADKALYAAKGKGRNRVIMADSLAVLSKARRVTRTLPVGKARRAGQSRSA